MKRMLSWCIALIVFSIAIACYPIRSYAGHDHAQKLEIDTYNFTADARYIDLLIKMDSDDEYYTKFNNDNMERFDFDKTKLAEYRDEAGYISFSCHYKDIYSDPIISKIKVRDIMISKNCFTLDKDLDIDLNVMEALFDKRREFKIAILDKDGSIIQVSDPFEVRSDDKDKGYLSTDVEYDISNNEIEYYWSSYYPTDSGIRIYNMSLLIGIVLFFVASIGFLVFRKLWNK